MQQGLDRLLHSRRKLAVLQRRNPVLIHFRGGAVLLLGAARTEPLALRDLFQRRRDAVGVVLLVAPVADQELGSQVLVVTHRAPAERTVVVLVIAVLAVDCCQPRSGVLLSSYGMSFITSAGCAASFGTRLSLFTTLRLKSEVAFAFKKAITWLLNSVFASGALFSSSYFEMLCLMHFYVSLHSKRLP